MKNKQQEQEFAAIVVTVCFVAIGAIVVGSIIADWVTKGGV